MSNFTDKFDDWVAESGMELDEIKHGLLGLVGEIGIRDMGQSPHSQDQAWYELKFTTQTVMLVVATPESVGGVYPEHGGRLDS